MAETVELGRGGKKGEWRTETPGVRVGRAARDREESWQFRIELPAAHEDHRELAELILRIIRYPAFESLMDVPQAR